MKKSYLKWVLRLCILAFIALNISAAFHGYSFTHFETTEVKKSKAEELSFTEKLSVLAFGIKNPRPKNQSFPTDPYQTFSIPSGEENLESWFIPADSAIGNILLFHGYGGYKSSMLSRAKIFNEMGYNCLLVDFRGSGGSSGNYTSIGYWEAEDVRSSVQYLQERFPGPTYVLGTSMGAAASMKAASDLNINGLILECPFESLLQTAKNRFEAMGLPPSPAAELLVFWGGIENGFWGFSHNPYEYAQEIETPTLLIYGEKDARVKRFEIDHIFENLNAQSELLILPKSSHGNYLETEREAWKNKLQEFLDKH